MRQVIALLKLFVPGLDLITSGHLHSEAVAAALGVHSHSWPSPPAGTSKISPPVWQAAAKGAMPRAREEEGAWDHRPLATTRRLSPGVNASPAA